ncbi:MAG: hypothetical protein AAB635_00605 [Patescibacteria group bacterium]
MAQLIVKVVTTVLPPEKVVPVPTRSIGQRRRRVKKDKTAVNPS